MNIETQIQNKPLMAGERSSRILLTIQRLSWLIGLTNAGNEILPESIKTWLDWLTIGIKCSGLDSLKRGVAFIVQVKYIKQIQLLFFNFQIFLVFYVVCSQITQRKLRGKLQATHMPSSDLESSVRCKIHQISLGTLNVPKYRRWTVKTNVSYGERELFLILFA